jgi:putative toxin-antitoxin system antitoxin component (TIGR02293 family)
VDMATIAATAETILGIAPRQSEEIIRGMPYRNFEKFLKATGLSLTQASEVFGITPGTLRRRKTEKCLAADESDRVYRAARVFSEIVEHNEGDEADAREWIHEPNPSLGQKAPYTLLGTELGTRKVSQLVGRLEHFAST